MKLDIVQNSNDRLEWKKSLDAQTCFGPPNPIVVWTFRQKKFEGTTSNSDEIINQKVEFFPIGPGLVGDAEVMFGSM